MTLNPRLVSEIIRQRMGLTDDSQSARIINAIPQALKAFSRKIAASPDTRQLLTTDKTTTSITIGAGGAVNLVTGYDSYQFLLEYFDLGEIYFLAKSECNVVQGPGPDVFAIISIEDNLNNFANLDRVQFLLITSALPSGMALLTNYYIVDYAIAVDGLSASFGIAANADGTGQVSVATDGLAPYYVQKMQPTTEQPMQMLKSPQQANLVNYLTSVFDYYYIQGNSLFVLPTTATGRVAFAVPFFPTTLTLLPESAEAENQFLDKLFEIVAGPGTDLAQDGEK